MKIKRITGIVCAIAAASILSGCEGEKQPNIIEGNLPIKTSTLYMVGSATPNGWNIDDPTPMTATEEDPLVFTWEGNLYEGEMKLCLTPGSWDAPFIRPIEAGAAIGKDEISNAPFKMHAGDPDDKWNVVAAGTYRLTFDLRNWNMSSTYLKEPEKPVIEPIETSTLFMIGDATPNGWSMDNATELTVSQDNKYIFSWEGELKTGTMKACTERDGTFSCPFIRPSSPECEISSAGVTASDFVYTTNPDDQWKVTEAGKYRITFDLQNWTIKAEYLGEVVPVKEPIETSTLFMIGDATPNGWSMDNATELTVSQDNKYIFSWEGELKTGTMKACTERDGTFSCPFIRPSSPECEISSAGVAASDFVYTTNPDDQWKVTEAGKYRITFDLENWTIKAEKLN